MSDRPHLHALAARLGILPTFVDVEGRSHLTSNGTRVRLVRALGFDASSEVAAMRAVRELDADDAHHAIDAVAVVPHDERSTRLLRIRRPRGATGDFRIELTAEDGSRESWEGRLAKSSPDPTVTLPPLDLGYCRIATWLDTTRGTDRFEQLRVVHPPSCYGVERALGRRRGFGVWTNLYALRSSTNWGVGDTGDLGALVEWCADIGGSFVGINPLHALRNRPPDVSPYYPLSRLFRNPIYLDVEAVPEFAESPEAREIVASDALRQELAQLRDADRIDYAKVWGLKCRVLQLLHRAFEQRHVRESTDRGAQYRRFCREHGERLDGFVRYAARHVEPGSPDLHRYLQFELDRQLEEAANRGRRAGLAIGVYNDLAIGSGPGGADAAAYPDLFVAGARLGAPPDALAARGQDWGLHPLHPRAMARDRYAYWIAVLRAGMRHAGALRIDHVMGLDRQFWIPTGRPAGEGAYVRYPTQDLFGILALESQRQKTVIVGESLGTLPHGFLEHLHRWGVLSSQVLYFERELSGAFWPAPHYSDRALVTVNTHDLPPLAGFWAGRDLEERRRIGLLDDETCARRRREREAEKAALRQRLLDGSPDMPEGELAPGETLCAGAHAFLGATRAPLVGVAFDDLAGEVDGVNVPGASWERYPAWTRRSRCSLAEVRENAVTRATVRAMAQTGRVSSGAVTP